MNNYFLSSLIALLFLGSCATSVKKSDKQYASAETATFMFYNVENLFDTIDNPNTRDDEFTPQGEKRWNSERYYKKLENLSTVVALADANQFPAFIGVSEVENKTVLEDWASMPAMKPHNYEVVHYDSNDGRGIDVGLLYQANVFQLLHSELIPVDYEPEPEQYPLREILYVKGIFYQTDTLHIFVNHWKSRRGGENETAYLRVKSANTLRKKTDELLNENADAKIIICGDMNDEPENKSLLVSLGAEKSPEAAQETGLYNLMYHKSVKDLGTYSYRGSWNMLDNLIVSRGFLNSETGYIVDEIEGEIVYDNKILYDNPKANGPVPSKTYGGDNYYGGYSDHLPVYFTMKKVQ